MFGLGPMEVAVLLALGGGGQTGELAAFLPADIYFKSRNIDTRIDNLAALASKDPADGKAQIAQLLALRMLAERADEVKKAENYKDILKTIEKIAKGEMAKDSQGFSRAHANHALTSLGGNGKPSEARPTDVRKDTLNWFPASATLVGAIDFSGHEATAEQGRDMRQFWSKMLKPRDWDDMFDVAEQIGNVRIDRVAFAFQDDDKHANKHDQFMMRASGRADHKRIVEVLKKTAGAKISVESSAQGGQPVSILKDSQGRSLMALIGDTDLVMGTRTRKLKKDEKDEANPIGDMLAVRAGKHMGVLAGNLKDSLQKVSGKACGLIAGHIPHEMREGLSHGFGAVPKSIRAEVSRDKLGLDIKFEGAFATADEAKTFTAKAFALRQLALEGIDKMPKDFPLPPATIAALKRTLESIQVQADGAAAKGGVFVPADVLRTLPSWWLMDVGAEAVPPPPPKGNKK